MLASPLWLLLGAPSARAQALPVVADDGDLGDLSYVWRPEAQGGVGFSARGEAALGDPLGFGAGVGLSLGLGERFALAASGALVSPGTGLIDARLAAPIGIVVPDRSHGGFGLSLVPQGHALLEGGLLGYGGGGALAFGFGRAGWQVAAHGGAAWGVPTSNPGASAGVYGLAGLGGHVEILRTLAVRAEVAAEPGAAGVPLQGGLSLRGRYPGGFAWTLGASAFLGSDGALGVRPGLALAFSPNRSMDRDADDDGVVDRIDACWKEPESANGWSDADGCPDELATVKLLVMDLAGKPIAGAAYQLGDQSGVADAQGGGALTGLMPETEPRIIVQARGFSPTSVVPLPLSEGENLQVVTLDWTPVPVRVRVRAADSGKPLVAHLRATGPGNVESQDVDASGEGTIKLRPGKWELVVYLDRYQDATFKIEVTPAMEPLALEVPLMRAGLGRSKEELLAEVRFPPGALDPIWGPTLDEVAHAFGVHPELRVAVRVAGGAPMSAAQPLIDALVAREVPRAALVIESAAGDKAEVSLFAIPERPLLLPELVLFDEGSASLRTDAPAVTGALDALAAGLAKEPRRPAQVHGHISKGEDPALSAARVSAVIEALVARGVAADRLAPVDWGDTRPRGTLGPESRRVQLTTRPIDDVAVVLSAESGVEALAAAAKRALAGDLALAVRVGAGAEAVGEDAVRALVTAGVPEGRVRVLPGAHAGQVVVGLWEPAPLAEVVQFAPGSSNLAPGAEAALDALAAQLRAAGRPAILRALAPPDPKKPELPADEKHAAARVEAVRAALVARGVPEGVLLPGSSGIVLVALDPLAKEGEAEKEHAARVEAARAASHRVELSWVE